MSIIVNMSIIVIMSIIVNMSIIAPFPRYLLGSVLLSAWLAETNNHIGKGLVEGWRTGQWTVPIE